MNTLFRFHDKLVSVDDMLDEQLRVATHMQQEWDRHVPVEMQEDERFLYRDVA